MPPSHTPRLLVLVWAIYAFPFTLWDAAYIFLRPHTFPGGKWHRPLFEPMVQWSDTDRIYGELGWENSEGFTAAQGVINVLEVTLYMVYFVIVWQHGGGFRRISFGGRPAAWAVLIGFAAGMVTATKTALYFMREIFSGYKYTGHNDYHPVFTLWGFMNLLYTAASLYMTLTFGKDILNGLSSNLTFDDESRKKHK